MHDKQPSNGVGDVLKSAHGGTRPPSVHTPPVFIDFENESATLDVGGIDLAALRSEYEKGKHFFVVGQSHGVSAVGVHTLAVRRSQAVAKAMIDYGIQPKSINTLASWSSERVPFAPTRGVQIFVLDRTEDPSRALLALQAS